MKRRLENWIESTELSMPQILAIAFVIGMCMMSIVAVSGSYIVGQYMKYKTYELATFAWNVKVDAGSAKQTDFEDVKKYAAEYNKYSLPFFKIDTSKLAR